MAEIRINLARAIQQAQQLSEASSVLKRSLNELNSEIQRISAYWDGEASSVFVKKLKEQYSDLAEQCRQLEQVAADIRLVVKRIKRREEAAQKAAEML